jgi:CHAD domain-containing protein
MTPANGDVELIRPDEAVLRVAVTSIRARLRRVRRLYSRAIANPNAAEPVHKLRVATRRATAALGMFGEFLPPRRAKRMAKLLKRIRRRAGAVRDCDVLIARFSSSQPQDDAPTFLRRIKASRVRSQAALVALYKKKVDSGRFKRKTRKLLGACLRRGVRCPEKAQQRFADWAPAHLRGLVDDFFQAASPDLDDFNQLHLFRIKAKSLRYAMELVAPAFPSEFRTEFYPLVERLQEILGSIHDEAQFLQTVAARLTETAKASDIAGLTHHMAQEQRTLEKLEQEFASWWTPERRDELQRRFEQLLLLQRDRPVLAGLSEN